ncbi:4-hydroxybenzoate octaprenyltransferase [Entomobacter blattae]|uniref:4-hydroxybenzoate octaprenyltransferase n=1 Tax=Entomobacter blattae TaxID=2762277 RepID=A0A7H1NQG3_9PROT|nr:4-hydroxybenzoate octaprenyltransferase [Entomobacter blattae]QNT78023.1 4-hydroxybenzoate octaprenyltransferase [Entomobacter blattae]
MPLTPTPSDIVYHNWISRLPSSVQPYLILARLDRPIGAWLLFLPGAWSILLAEKTPSIQQFWLLALFGAGSIIMRSAGCVINDLWDRDIDRKVARTADRPLASGQISAKKATIFLAVLLSLGLLILLQLNPLAQILGASSLILVAFYPLAKRYTWWPQLVMGFTFGFGAPLGYAAAANKVDMLLGLVYLATIFWQLGYDTIYGFQDMEDDARIGVKSTSRRWAKTPRRFVAACYCGMIFFLGITGYAAALGILYWGSLALAAAYLCRQIVRLDTTNPSYCLYQFKEHRLIGIIIAIGFGFGHFSF